jgi:SulP family sulfate permease
VLVDLTIAIEVGVVLSALLFMKRMADAGESKLTAEIDCDVLEDYSLLPKGISIYEISGPLFFASAKQYAEVIKSTGIKSKIIIIRMRHVPFVDSTGMQNLKASINALLDSGTMVVLSGVNNQVKADLQKNNIIDMIGQQNVFDTFDRAVVYAKDELVNIRSSQSY